MSSREGALRGKVARGKAGPCWYLVKLIQVLGGGGGGKRRKGQDIFEDLTAYETNI